MPTLEVSTFNVVNSIPSIEVDDSTQNVEEQTNQLDNSLIEVPLGTTDVPDKDDMCPACFSIYSTNGDWSGWILQDGAHYCSQLCADHVHCSECTTMLGRQPWEYKLSVWGDTCLCSYDCWLRYCKRMEEEYPESDDEIAVDVDAV